MLGYPEPKYCKLIFQKNTRLSQAKVVSIDLSDKYLIGYRFLMGDEYLIYEAEVLLTDLSDKYLIGLSQSIVISSFRQRNIGDILY